MIALLVFLAGLACIVTGVTLISNPAAWITAGAGLIAVAAIWARGDNAPPEDQ